MSLRLRPLHLALLCALACATAQAGDLQQAYDLARQSDPQLAGSEANKRAVEEGIVQARANLLPQINATGTLLRTNTNGSAISEFQRADGSIGLGPEADSQNTTSRNYSGNIQQTIYNRAFFTGLSASQSRAHQADAQYDNAAQTLITRVAQAYFNVLSAIQDLASSRAEDRSLKRQLDQANVRLQVGLAPITDAEEAKAQYDISRATTIDYETALADAREALTEITGQPIEHFKGLAPDFAPTAPTPENVDAWVKMAVDDNPQVIAQQRAVDAAEHDVDTARAGHLPTITANAAYGDFTQWGTEGQDGFNAPGNAINRGPTYSLVLTVPIFSGFSVSSHVRQALATRDAAADTLEQTRRSIQRQARNSYHATVAGLTEIDARKQALLSAQTALEATQTGLEVGTRTIVDVLINEQQLFQAQRDYARARNNFVVNGLLLRQAAGNIQASDVSSVNALLVSDAEAALDVPDNADDATMPGLPTLPKTTIPAASGDSASTSPGTPVQAKGKKARKAHKAPPAPTATQPPTN